MADDRYLITLDPPVNSTHSPQIGGTITEDQYPELSLNSVRELIEKIVLDCDEIQQTAFSQFQYYSNNKLPELLIFLVYFNYHHNSELNESQKISTLNLISLILLSEDLTRFHILQEMWTQMDNESRNLLIHFSNQNFANKHLKIRAITAYIFANLMNLDITYWLLIFREYLENIFFKYSIPRRYNQFNPNSQRN
jgi:uncharacterized small protein (DUF1192 family)